MTSKSPVTKRSASSTFVPPPLKGGLSSVLLCKGEPVPTVRDAEEQPVPIHREGGGFLFTNHWSLFTNN